MENNYLLLYFDGDGYTYQWFDTLEDVKDFIKDESLTYENIEGFYDMSRTFGESIKELFK